MQKVFWASNLQRWPLRKLLKRDAKELHVIQLAAMDSSPTPPFANILCGLYEFYLGFHTRKRKLQKSGFWLVIVGTGSNKLAAMDASRVGDFSD